MPRNLKLTLAYNGTGFHGWQIQPEKPTIQGALVEAIREITGESVTVHGSGHWLMDEARDQVVPKLAAFFGG